MAALACESPFVLAALVGAIAGAGAAAGVGGQVARSLRMAAIVALPIVVVNVLVSRGGLTVFLRLGDLGPFGQGDLTVEALVYGVVIALKVSLLMLATTLGSLAVDPDELLRGVRRLSFRSALTASLATRMIPVLAGDARRLAEAQRTRDARARAARRGLLTHARAQGTLVSAMLSSSLDRALDVAATLELRGFAEGRRAQRRAIPWSRHDLALSLRRPRGGRGARGGARLAGIAAFDAYPEIKAAERYRNTCAEHSAGAGDPGPVRLCPDRRGVEP